MTAVMGIAIAKLGIAPGQDVVTDYPAGYLDDRGRIVLVKEAWSHGGVRRFGAYRVNDRGFLERIRSVWLPMRLTMEQAQEDLVYYAGYREWKAIE